MNIPKLIFRLLLGRRLPITAGTLEVPGIKAPVSIRRDRYGIAYIEAQNDRDAWYGLGFCHGQDRAFQLEGLIRIVHGTMSELAGPDTLPIDRLSRRIGFAHSARQQWEILDNEIRVMLNAYAQGVNSGSRAGCSKTAHEFSLLGIKPAPYSGADVLGVLKLMSFNLASNWDIELARLKVLIEDGPYALKAIDPVYPERQAVAFPQKVPAGKAMDRLAEDLAIFTAAAGYGGGSNNWVIAPSRTVTGRPILANDPHLSPSLPSNWYLVNIQTPEWKLAGASFVGAPCIPSGFNGTGAWGMTSGLVDNTDLFIEEIGPDGQSVRQGDQFVPCDIRKEIIHIKGKKPIEEKVLVTPRGPIISPALEGDFGAISMRAVWLDARPLKGFFQMHRVRSFEEFRQAFKEWPAASFNMVYADTSGAIGWQLVGEAPQRKKGYGTIPLPGSDPDVGWKNETVPFELMPYLYNPEAGFIATANNKPALTKEKPFLGVDWVDSYRADRIKEVIKTRKNWDQSGTQELQMDQESIPWRELRDIVLAVNADTDEARQALDFLKAWNGMVAADSPAAAVYELFTSDMMRRIVEAKAPRTAGWALGKGFTLLSPHSVLAIRRFGHMVRLIRNQPEGWFKISWAKEMADALGTAVKTLRKRCGNNTNNWAWGSVRPLTIPHPFGGKAPLDKIFNLGPFAWGGDTSTVGQAAVDLLDPAANTIFMASLRMVLDVGNWDENRFSIPGGQSGNPLSIHYSDLLPFWQKGEGVHIAWSKEKIEQEAQSKLKLINK